jgi:hypothetical protein
VQFLLQGNISIDLGSASTVHFFISPLTIVVSILLVDVSVSWLHALGWDFCGGKRTEYYVCF